MNWQTMNVSTNSGSKPSALEHPLRETTLLLGTGAALALFHQAYDLSLGLPGHFGLIWMAVIVIARGAANTRWAALIAACAYAGTTGAVATHGLGLAPIYLVVALAIDGFWRLEPQSITGPLFAGFAGGVAFAVKPLIALGLVTALGLQVGSLRHGFAFPLLTHFCFGAVGAVIGALALSGAGSLRRR